MLPLDGPAIGDISSVIADRDLLDAALKLLQRDGSVIPIGPAMPSSTGGAVAEFSPDGSQVLAFYNCDRSTWLLEADGSGGEEVDWDPEGAFTWQRLAP